MQGEGCEFDTFYALVKLKVADEEMRCLCDVRKVESQVSIRKERAAIVIGTDLVGHRCSL